VLADPDLLEEVTYLVEYPVVLRGTFDDEFLELPGPVVINAMREHQRYFSIVDKEGKLMPYFMTVANTRASDMDVVTRGNERVLRARLNDAKFYFDRDVKTDLVEMVERLKGVVFQKRLGTSYEKVERFTRLALFIGSRAGFSEDLQEGEGPADFLTQSFNPAQYDAGKVDPGLYSKFVLGRASMLVKADLTSGMVGEFPKLQGVMGSVYAALGHETPEVSAAAVEHYLPLASGGALPETTAGAIISIADKLDTIVGCFSVGLVPTGAQDPYALRRQALGVLSILGEKGVKVPLDEMVDKSIELLSDKLQRGAQEVKGGVLEFFRERFRNQLRAQGLPFDSIDSVLSAPSAPWFEIPDALKRIRAIEGFKKHPACADLVIAFKRVSNILKGQDLGEKGPDAALFKESHEKELYDLSAKLTPVINACWKKGDYTRVFETLASIKDKIDAFFDHVMVMVEDPETRENRLLLLSTVRNLYFKIADLSRLVV
jgi:glycyl-tRNA synthetase beta chain